MSKRFRNIIFRTTGLGTLPFLPDLFFFFFFLQEILIIFFFFFFFRFSMEQFQKAIRKVRQVQRMRKQRGYAFSQGDEGQARLLQAYDTTQQRGRYGERLTADTKGPRR